MPATRVQPLALSTNVKKNAHDDAIQNCKSLAISAQAFRPFARCHAASKAFTFGSRFDQRLDDATLPSEVQNLTSSLDFNQILDTTTMPAGWTSSSSESDDNVDPAMYYEYVDYRRHYWVGDMPPFDPWPGYVWTVVGVRHLHPWVTTFMEAGERNTCAGGCDRVRLQQKQERRKI